MEKKKMFWSLHFSKRKKNFNPIYIEFNCYKKECEQEKKKKKKHIIATYRFCKRIFWNTQKLGF